MCPPIAVYTLSAILAVTSMSPMLSSVNPLEPRTMVSAVESQFASTSTLAAVKYPVPFISASISAFEMASAWLASALIKLNESPSSPAEPTVAVMFDTNSDSTDTLPPALTLDAKEDKTMYAFCTASVVAFVIFTAMLASDMLTAVVTTSASALALPSAFTEMFPATVMVPTAFI